MKTYISLSGFDTSQIVSLIVKYGIARGDCIVLIRPEEEKDSRGDSTVLAIKELSKQIDSTIEVQIHRVDHHDFEGMVISMIDLLKSANGDVVVNLSGGPREIFLAFILACLTQSRRIYKTTNFSDIDRTMNEIVLPNITLVLDERLKRVLKDVAENGPTTIKEIALRLKISESSVSRQISELVEMKTLAINQKGKTKEIRINLAGKMLL